MIVLNNWSVSDALPVYRLLSDASVKRIAFQLIYLAGTLLTKTTATAECDPFKLIYSWKCLNYNLWWAMWSISVDLAGAFLVTKFF